MDGATAGTQRQNQQQRLYRLELMVETVTWNDRRFEDDNDDDDDDDDEYYCSAAVGFPQTECHAPAATDPERVKCVDRGRTYAFPVLAADSACACVVSLYIRRRSDCLLVASGELEVPLQPPDAAAAAADSHPVAADERTVAMTVPAADDDRTAAWLTVRARAWLAGHETVAEVTSWSPPPPATAGCRPDSPRKVECCRAPDSSPKPGCCTPGPFPESDTCCGERRERATTATPASCRHDRKKKSVAATCCVAQSACRRRCDVYPAPAVPYVPGPHRQYSTIGCEIDGRKVDLRVRKKNFETCAAQMKIAENAEAFAARVLAVVNEMHELVTTMMGAELDDPDGDSVYSS